MSTDSRPAIRVVHHMARTGGTLFCRCLASMENVVLLSEIHPLGLRMYHPLDQADRWYSLMTDEDLNWYRAQPRSFAEMIGRIEQRCAESGRLLVLRDWSHLDFTGLPFASESYTSRLAAELSNDFSLLRIATVRHPLDQWISLTRNPMFQEQLTAKRYITGVLRFTDLAKETGFLRYEDLTRSPDETLTSLCEALEISFDPAYSKRWSSYDNITGDVRPGRAEAEITSLPRQQAPPELIDELLELPEYERALQRLGYADQGG